MSLKRNLLFIGILASIFSAKINKKYNITPIELGLASVRKNTIVYSAPFKKSPSVWKIMHDHWPVLIVEIDNNWIKIEDSYETSGWIHKKNLLPPHALVLEKIEINDEIVILPNASVEFVKNEGTFCAIKIHNKNYLVECSKLWYKKDL